MESLKLDELGKFANLALNNRGTAYARQGQLDLAVADFEAAIKLSPTDPLAYRNRALALSRLTLTDDFKPDIEGEYIGFGAVLSWDKGDVTTRIYDDLLNLAHQAEYCDRMGEVMIPLGDPGALDAWFQRMGQRFEAIGLIDRLIYALSIGD